MFRRKLRQSIWRKRLMHDSGRRRKWMHLDKETGTVGKLFFLRCEEKNWDQWISLLEKILYTGNYCCLCHQLKQSVFDVAAWEILLFGYWLHCASWVSQHSRYLPPKLLLIDTEWSSLPFLISLLMHVLVFSPKTSETRPEHIKVLQPK